MTRYMSGGTPDKSQHQVACELQGRRIEAPGLPALVLPVNSRRWVFGRQHVLTRPVGPSTSATSTSTIGMSKGDSVTYEERTRALRQEVNYMVAHSLHRHSESLLNAFEHVALHVIQEIMKNQYSPSGPTLGSHKGELSFQTRPPLPYTFAASE
jgi:hypothetical protein